MNFYEKEEVKMVLKFYVGYLKNGDFIERNGYVKELKDMSGGELLI